MWMLYARCLPQQPNAHVSSWTKNQLKLGWCFSFMYCTGLPDYIWTISPYLSLNFANWLSNFAKWGKIEKGPPKKNFFCTKLFWMAKISINEQIFYLYHYFEHNFRIIIVSHHKPVKWIQDVHLLRNSTN